MTAYRLYFLNEHGRIIGAEEFLADSDQAAVARANALRAGGKAELWQLGRLVCCFDGVEA